MNQESISKYSEINLKNNLDGYINDNSYINNNRFKIISKSNSFIKKDDLQKIHIDQDGNCFYRSVSYLLLGSQEYYKEIKKEIIDWIEENKKQFIDFFGDDNANNIIKEELLKTKSIILKKKICGADIIHWK